MVIDILLFLVGFVCLIKGGDWFVDGATGIAKRFHVPEILIGATVVAIGTTIPEVMVSATGAITGGDGGSAMAYGNAIGSVICNTALIAAITLAVRPAPIDRKSIKVPIIFFFIAAIFYSLVAYTGFLTDKNGNQYSRIAGIILLLIFVAYIVLSVHQARNGKAPEADVESSDEPEDNSSKTLVKNIVLLIAGAAVIAVGANLLVNHGTKIAEALGVPATVIALTFVALGTSLPELITAITALAKGHSDLSLGNVIGANLFNLVLVTGVATTISPFKVPVANTITIAGNEMLTSLAIEIPLMLIVMLIMSIPALVKQKLYRWQGILLLLIYVGFCAFQFIS